MSCYQAWLALAGIFRLGKLDCRGSCYPPSKKTSGVCLIPSPVPKSEGYFDFAQYRLGGTLIVVGIAPGDRGHPPVGPDGNVNGRPGIHPRQYNGIMGKGF